MIGSNKIGVKLMTSHKTYWRSFKKSLTQPDYYLEMIEASFWFLFKFFAVTMLWLGLLLAWRINRRILPQFKTSFEQTSHQLKTHYPASLVLNWDGQELTSSADEPLAISWPILPSFVPNQEQFEGPATFAYLTDQALTPTEFSEVLGGESWLVVTKDQLFISDLRQNWTKSPLNSFLPNEKTKLDQQELTQLIDQSQVWLDKVLNQIKKINYLLAPLFISGLVLVSSLLDGLVLFLLLKLNQLPLNFGQTIKLSLHIAIIAEFVRQLSSWLYPNLKWSMFALTYWLIVIYILWTQRKKLAEL